MRRGSLPGLAFLLVAAAAQAQPAAGDAAARPQPGSPIASLDDASLAGSARAKKLIGSKVYQADTAVGEIEDVLVDLEHARLTAVILSVGGVLGIGDKLVAVPADQIRISNEAKFTTDLTKDQLTRAPAFDPGKLR